MNIVVGPCKCGGYGQCYDGDAEKEIGRCHDELGAILDQGRMGEGEMGEWIEWKGGECPVARDVLVEAKLRNGEPMRLKASNVYWGELGKVTVVAYRIAKETIHKADVPQDQINPGHYLELMDRLHVAISTFEDHIRTHPLTEKHADLRSMADAVGGMMADMYTRTGQLEQD